MKRGAAPKFRELGSSPVKQTYTTQAIDTAKPGGEIGGWTSGSMPQHFVDGVNITQQNLDNSQGSSNRHWSGAQKGSIDAVIMDVIVPGGALVKGYKFLRGLNIFNSVKKSHKATKAYNKIKHGDSKLLGGKDGTFSQVKQTIANNPIATSTVVSAVGANVINDIVENKTEEAQTENSSKLGNITSDKEKRQKIQDENIRLEFKDRDLNQSEMYTKRDKFYSDFKKNNPTLKGHPYNYLTDKKSEHYNPDFSLLQNKIYKTHEAGILRGGSGNVADTSGGNPTLKH